MPDVQALLLNATVLTALIGAVIAVAKIWHTSLERRRIAVNALFAELAHITRHFAVSASELTEPSPPEIINRRLRWSKYGPVSGSANLKELAILGPQQIAEFLQLAFVIRNTDTLIDELLSAKAPLTPSQLAALTERMADVAIHADNLVTYIREHTRGLPPIKWE